MRRAHPIVAATLLFIGISHCLSADELSPGIQNVMLIGWDGAQREHLIELFAAGKLPNLRALVGEGSIIPTQVTTGPTQTKSGWAEILTGYSAPFLGVLSNRDYQPIRKGLTIFERLKEHLREEKFMTVFIAGKNYNVGGRGPHEVCENCLGRDPITHELLLYWDKQRFTGGARFTRDNQPPRWVRRDGEPYFHAKAACDYFEVGLGGANHVGSRALTLLEKCRGSRFFAFIHFEEPDEQGHLHGENSAQYEQAFATADMWLGQIVRQLRELGMYDRTAVFVTTDHGMDEDDFDHRQSPNTFLATNQKRVSPSGDRKDLGPTILSVFGVDVAKITPRLDGVSLLEKPVVDFALGDVGALLDAAPTASAGSQTSVSSPVRSTNAPIRIGYFHGGRSVLLYRTYVFGFFGNESADVELHTKWLDGNQTFKIPPSYSSAEALRVGRKYFGKIDGMEIIEKILTGEFDGGTVGESSFLYYAGRGAPIVAVAMLGHDVPGEGGKGIVFRNGVKIRSPADLKNKTLVSRRAGPGDAIFLREFLESLGMAGDPSIRIIDDLDEDEVVRMLEEGKIDGGLYHLRTLQRIIEKRQLAYVYRPMDWMNPELSHSLLIFHKDVVKRRPETVEKIVRAYMKRIDFERSLPANQREASQDKSLMMELRYEGMSIPDYDFPPLVRLDLLEEMHRLLVKYKYSTGKPDLRNYVDNRFVERAAQTMRSKK